MEVRCAWNSGYSRKHEEVTFLDMNEDSVQITTRPGLQEVLEARKRLGFGDGTE